MKLLQNKLIVIFCSTILGLYGLYLILPYVLSPIANSYTDKIETIIKDNTGLEANIEGVRFVTTPKLGCGLKIENISLKDTKNALDLTSKNSSIILDLKPIITKKIQLEKISSDNLGATFTLTKDGKFALEELFSNNDNEQQKTGMSLPYGLKLSNKLPDVKIKQYKFELQDYDKKSYFVSGQNFKITDFVINRKVKISTKGEIIFNNEKVSNYDIKIYNKIMPQIDFNDLVFPKEITENNSKNSEIPGININEILNSINKNKLHIDINSDIKTSGTYKKPIQNGYFNIENLSVAVNDKKLPNSYAKLKFKGTKTNIDSEIFTSDDENETTKISGQIKRGGLDLSVKSNAKLNNLIRLFDSVAQTFGINDYKTLSATGAIDTDFNIKSDYKTLTSNGYLKINPSTIKYDLYNILINNINADINLDNNNVNIKQAGFSIDSHPLKLVGIITKDAVADLKLTADKLLIKGLLLTAGQGAILKENNINSGYLSLFATAKGKLTELKPDINLTISDVNLLNKSSNAQLTLKNALIKLLLIKDKISGNIDINSLGVKINGAIVSIPNSSIVMDTKDINIKNSYVLVNNSKVNVTGAVTDYLTDKLNINILAKGNLASSDIMAFIPKEFHSMFPYKGSMPIEIKATGNDKEQDICFNLEATPSGYIQFADINLLNGKTTKIHADAKIKGNNIKLENSGVFANKSQIATFDGGISNIDKNPKMNIAVSVPNEVSFPIPGMGKSSKLRAYGLIDIIGYLNNPRFKGKVTIPEISVKDMDFSLTNMIGNLDGNGISGTAIAENFKFGGITAQNLTSDFLLKDFSNFYLTNVNAKSFNGKVNGKLSYNLPTFAFAIDFTGKGLNSEEAIYGAVGIQKALTGTLDFRAKLTGKGVTETQIIKSLNGDVDFSVNDGRFVSIGKLENFVRAQNITSNSLLKSAISALSTAHTIQESDRFKSIIGSMTLLNGIANLTNIKVAGPLMSYYVKGTYNILQNSANLVILGRLDAKIVSLLGPFGQLSAEKLLSYIPKFGPATAQFLNIITQDPKNEKTELIPALSSGSTTFKDFKVMFNGSIERASSVKSFKWLSKCDTTQINIKQDLQNAQKAVKTNIENQIKDTKTKIENTQKNIDNAIQYHKQSIEQTKQDVQNIKKNAGQNATNLGKLLFNAASNANKKIETPKTQPQETQSTSGE